MLLFKINKILTLSILISSVLTAQNDKFIYHSSKMTLEKFDLNLTMFKNKTDTNLVRVLLKITPTNDSAKYLLSENKAIIMFNKKDIIEIVDKNKESIYPNDYIYEEGYGYIYLIYTFLKMDISSVGGLKLNDILLTNSIKITII